MGIRKSCYTAQGPQGSLFVVQLLKIPCKRVIFYQKVKPQNPEVGLNWDVTRRSESYFLVAMTTFISYRENRKYIRLTEKEPRRDWLRIEFAGNSLLQLRVRWCFVVGANSRKLTPPYQPQQQIYEHNISWQQSLFKKKKECPLSQRILKHSRQKWLLRF